MLSKSFYYFFGGGKYELCLFENFCSFRFNCFFGLFQLMSWALSEWKNIKGRTFSVYFWVFQKWNFFQIGNPCFKFSQSPIIFSIVTGIFETPFSFKHSNSELKMSATWKCFDGIQRDETSVSDVRNEFRFQIYKTLFLWQLDCQMFVHYRWSKGNIINAIITYQLYFKRLTAYFCNFPLLSNSTERY